MELSKQKVTGPMTREERLMTRHHPYGVEGTLDELRAALVSSGWNRSLANIRVRVLAPQIRKHLNREEHSHDPADAD